MRTRLSLVTLQYLLRATRNTFQERVCPYCDEKTSVIIDTKFGVTRLLRCETCGLNYRHPKDSESFFEDFYQVDYDVDNAMITQLPTDDELHKLVEDNFPNLRDYSPYVKALFPRNETKAPKLFEFGCSWGYSLYQFTRAGFDAKGYEVSKPRANFGREKLGVSISSDLHEIVNENDIFFSSHVIEHLTDLRQFVDLARSKLGRAGIFVALCPNGSPEFRARRPDVFHGGWGLEHINYLTVDFAQNVFQDHPFLIMTGDWTFPIDVLARWSGDSQITGEKRDGEELLIVSKLNETI